MKKQQLEIIFTRDFNFWVNQLTTDLYHKEFPKVWGRSLKNQIITYNGRASNWCRFPKDVEQLSKYMAKKPLSSSFFQLPEHKDFRKNILKLRKLIKQPIGKIKNPSAHLKLLTDLFSYKFTYNSLGVFLPGLWKQNFIRFHKKEKRKAEQIVEWAQETRQIAEGIHKEVGDYMRKWLGPMLEKRGYPNNYVKLLSVRETKKFVENNTLPNIKILSSRAKGFVYMRGKLYTIQNLKKFFSNHNIELLEEKVGQNTTEIKGVTAYPGKPVWGKVRIIMNSDELKYFKKGEVLVSSMTAPDYLGAMKKSVAIVTDEGGMLCHAAIVSRELKIPCVIGTKVATKFFMNEDMVEVNAASGIIKKL